MALERPRDFLVLQLVWWTMYAAHDSSKSPSIMGTSIGGVGKFRLEREREVGKKLDVLVFNE